LPDDRKIMRQQRSHSTGGSNKSEGKGIRKVSSEETMPQGVEEFDQLIKNN